MIRLRAIAWLLTCGLGLIVWHSLTPSGWRRMRARVIANRKRKE